MHLLMVVTSILMAKGKSVDAVFNDKGAILIESVRSAKVRDAEHNMVRIIMYMSLN